MSYKYEKDRKFTEKAHKIALREIYSKLNWKIFEDISNDIITYMDINCGIDRIFKDDVGNILTVQERFRDNNYKEYFDFTIRYKREYSQKTERVLSEFYKIRADFIVYGILNCSKSDIDIEKSTFLKYVVVNLKQFFYLCETAFIDIDVSGKSFYDEEGKKFYMGLKYNRDGSSNFVVVNVPSFYRFLKDINISPERIIILEKNFLQLEDSSDDRHRF